MKRKKIWVSSICFLMMLFAQSQVKDSLFEIKSEIIKYYVNDSIVSYKETTITNNSTKNFGVWIAKNENETISDYIKQEFGDFSFNDLLYEENLDSYSFFIYFNFIKVIEPKKSFTIINLDDNKNEIIRYGELDKLPKAILSAMKHNYIERIYPYNTLVIP